MPDSSRLIVLKFGGSVLLDEQRLRIAVHEIYRWRREGWQVLAVVSALAGRTEDLITRCDTLYPTASPTTKAHVLSLGETESAALLGVHLDRAGVPASVLYPGGVKLIAEGDPLDAEPVSVNPDTIQRALDAHGVVVFPGFLATDHAGECVTLGRGGSDLTAVFLAHALKAERCRLIKDVDGLYTADPAKSSTPPRYAYASYDDALSTDGSIIQHKAVEFAQRHRLEFELGRFNGTRPTAIGALDSVLSAQNDVPHPLTVTVCGLGVVGGGVVDLLQQLPDLFQIVGGARRTPESPLIHPFPVTDDAVRLASSGADAVVELIGGTETALRVAQSALEAGSSLITANKTLIADHGQSLIALTGEPTQRVLASASVGGVAPVLESLREGKVLSVEGILNGTGNFILEELEAGAKLDNAVCDAQARGFAEADPTRDLDGRDALDKLLVIASSLGWEIPQERTRRTTIQGWSTSAERMYPARHVAFVDRTGASVIVEHVKNDSLLSQIHDEWNVAKISYTDGSTETVRGKGAGRWPTSEAVLADLLELSRVHAGINIEESCHA